MENSSLNNMFVTGASSLNPEVMNSEVLRASRVKTAIEEYKEFM